MLALALIHHVTIAANVPVREFVDWLASLGTSLVIEFPTREDVMVKTLLGPKREGLHPDYERENFERVLAAAFDVERRERLGRRHPPAVLRPPQGAGQPDRPHRPRADERRGRRGRGQAPAAPRESRGLAGNLLAFGHLAVLCAFALAQPLFNLLSDNPEFFAARGSTASEIIVFARAAGAWCRRRSCWRDRAARRSGQRARPRRIVHLVFMRRPGRRGLRPGAQEGDRRLATPC